MQKGGTGAYFRGLRPGKPLANMLVPSAAGRSGRRTARAWGLVRFGREVYCPRRPLEVVKPWQARNNPKEGWVLQNPRPQNEMDVGNPRP